MWQISIQLHKVNSYQGISVSDYHGNVLFVVVTITSSLPLITWCVTKVTQWMPLVKQELLTIPELPFSRLFFVGFVLLNYDVHCLSFLSFFLSHCIVWSFHLQLMITPSVSLVLPFTAYDCSFSIFGPSIYSLWLFLWYLWSFHLRLMIVPSVSLVLPFTAYDCSFGIFKLF